MTKVLWLIATAVGAIGCFVGAAVDKPAKDRTPVELGKVQWGRDLDAARETAKQTKKPLLLFFQEVPG